MSDELEEMAYRLSRDTNVPVSVEADDGVVSVYAMIDGERYGLAYRLESATIEKIEGAVRASIDSTVRYYAFRDWMAQDHDRAKVPEELAKDFAYMVSQLGEPVVVAHVDGVLRMVWGSDGNWAWVNAGIGGTYNGGTAHHGVSGVLFGGNELWKYAGAIGGSINRHGMKVA